MRRVHDPLCPLPECDYGTADGDCLGYDDCLHQCQCDLIAKADARGEARGRADERGKAAKRVNRVPARLIGSDVLVLLDDAVIAAARGEES